MIQGNPKRMKLHRRLYGILLQWIPDIWIHSKSFYNVVFYTYLGSNAAEKNEFNILIAVLHISGILIYLELKIKSSFLRIIKKLIIKNLLSFCADQWWSITAVLSFNNYQDDISSALAMYSYIWDWLYLTICFLILMISRRCQIGFFSLQNH